MEKIKVELGENEVKEVENIEELIKLMENYYKDEEERAIAIITIEELEEANIKIEKIVFKEGIIMIIAEGVRERLEIVYRTEDGYISQYCYYSEESGEIECESTPGDVRYEVLRIYYSPP